ncbi:MAG TPA: alpha-amylase family glycosyl hydrolase [Chitinispirillaceae bacterium]|nr:alpha-amylase family glycosyl hydrolase [Chitinispirillaceae bacterium]
MSEWFENAIFYHVYPLGALGAPLRNDFSTENVSRLSQLDSWVPYLQELGITALYIGPLFESMTHGYDTKDYFKVDRRLGTNDDLRRFVAKCHEAGIRVILDAVFNHVGREFFAFKDLINNGWNSQYRSWFHTDFGRQSCFGDRFWYEGWNGHYNLVKLNLPDEQLRQYLSEVVRFWIREFDIDGLRFDAADVMDKQFFALMRSLCKSIKRDFWLMGEVIHGDYRTWVNKDCLDSVTNYECFKGLWSSHNDKNYFETAYSVNRQSGENGIYKGLNLYNFTDNHDVDRVASKLREPAHLYPLYILLFTLPGIPSIYYGSEWGITGKKEGGNDLPLRPHIDISSSMATVRNSPLFKVICRLIAIRKKQDPLQRGNYSTLLTASEQYCFSRQCDGTTVIVSVNAKKESCSVRFPVTCGKGTAFTDILNNNETFYAENGHLSTPVESCWGRILVQNK